MKIGLFFGSFNPIHIGHLIIADSLLMAANLDEVWFVVSPQNPFKEKSGLAKVEFRIKWAKKCLAPHQNLKVCSIETTLPLPSYTEQTLKALQQKHTEHQFHILMGSDSYASLPTWKNAKNWMDDYPVEVYQRKGTEIKELLTEKSHIHRLPLLPISATQLRKKIKQKESVRFWILEEVRNEIESTYS